MTQRSNATAVEAPTRNVRNVDALKVALRLAKRRLTDLEFEVATLERELWEAWHADQQKATG